MSDALAIGEALRAIRTRKELPLVTVAERAGLSVPELHQFERGKQVLPSTTLLRLLGALHAGLEDLQVELEGGTPSPARAARRAAEWLLRYSDALEGSGR